MFRVFYKYSACISVVTSDTTILCDPWFSDNAYHGTWARFPRFELSSSFIGDFDFIFLSHIHPDHYCKESILKLFDLFGPKPILISERANPNYLQKKLLADGFGPHLQVLSHLVVGGTRLDFIPVDTGSTSDVDSSLLISSLSTRYAFLNTNDCEITPKYASAINLFIS